jgi:branched-chain amino acid aminotransferase
LDGSFIELASIDGVIAPSVDATIPLLDDGLYRGDGAFEVVRLYKGFHSRLRITWPGWKDRRVEFDRTAVHTETFALLEKAGPVEGQLRFIPTRGGRRILATENIPDPQVAISLASVTDQPTIMLN